MKKNRFMPSQPKIDQAKLRSQISRRADVSFPVFARPVWHAGYANREAGLVWHARHSGHELGMPSITDFDVRSSTTSSPNISHGSLKLRVSCLAINADFNKKKVMFVIMYVTESTGKTEDR